MTDRGGLRGSLFFFCNGIGSAKPQNMLDFPHLNLDLNRQNNTNGYDMKNIETISCCV